MTTSTKTSTKTKKLYTAARIVLALIFCLSGLNHIAGLVPMPAMTGDSALFWQGLRQSGYFFPLLGLVELCAGALLAWGRMVPLALVMVAPVIVNVVAFHVALAPQGMGAATVVLAAAVVLAHRERSAFKAMFAVRPGGSADARFVEVLMGIVFVVSGVAGFLGRTPPPSTAGAAAMMNGLAAAGYFLPLLSGVQVIAGVSLIVRRFTGVALLALAPIVIEIFAYRLSVAVASPRMVLMATFLLAGEAWLCFAHRRLFAPLSGPSPSIDLARPRVLSGAVRS